MSQEQLYAVYPDHDESDPYHMYLSLQNITETVYYAKSPYTGIFLTYEVYLRKVSNEWEWSTNFDQDLDPYLTYQSFQSCSTLTHQNGIIKGYNETNPYLVKDLNWLNDNNPPLPNYLSENYQKNLIQQLYGMNSTERAVFKNYLQFNQYPMYQYLNLANFPGSNNNIFYQNFLYIQQYLLQKTNSKWQWQFGSNYKSMSDVQPTQWQECSDQKTTSGMFQGHSLDTDQRRLIDWMFRYDLKFPSELKH